jgi:hypothetical protein
VVYSKKYNHINYILHTRIERKKKFLFLKLPKGLQNMERVWIPLKRKEMN